METYLSYAARISLLFFFAIIPLADVLPYQLAWENGPIETAQVVVLLFAVFANLVLARRAPSLAGLHRFMAAFLFLLALREVSYGRVFFETSSDPVLGPQFIDMQDFPGHTAIYAFLAFYILALLIALVRVIPWRRVVDSPKPWLFFVLAILCALLSTAGDHAWMLEGMESETMEELAELLMYLTFFHISLWYHVRWKKYGER